MGETLELAALEDVAFFSDLILEELDLSFEFEFEQAPSKLSDNKEIAIKYAKKLQEKGAKNVLVSMGGMGAVLVDENRKDFQIVNSNQYLIQSNTPFRKRNKTLFESKSNNNYDNFKSNTDNDDEIVVRNQILKY